MIEQLKYPHRTHGGKVLQYNKTALLIGLETLLSLACVVCILN